MGKRTYPRGKDSGSNCEAQAERQVRQRGTDEKPIGSRCLVHLPPLVCSAGERELPDRVVK